MEFLKLDSHLRVSQFDLLIKVFFGKVQNYRDKPIYIKLSGSDDK
jgi:hypothetical protein